MRTQDVATPSRFVTLDALRGIAAIMVVCFHSQGALGTWRPHFGYLAVDLFFVLSGFVIAYSNDAKLEGGLGPKAFMKKRFVRLYPIYLLGLVLAIISIPFNKDIASGDIASAYLQAPFHLIGIPFAIHGKSNFIFQDNIPFWSLFFEFWVLNLAYALFFHFLQKWRLAALVVVCALGLIVSEKIFYRVDVGASWDTFAAGFPRAGFSFFIGVAAARLHQVTPAPIHLPSWLYGVMLCCLLAVPLHDRLAHIYELVCVLIIFPVMVYLAAGSIERRPWLGARLGDASYAVYAIHYPLLALGTFCILKGGGRASLLWEVAFVVVLIPIALIADTFYDQPIRRLLNKKLYLVTANPSAR